MKVGDLVELSSYGRKLRGYKTLHDKVGFVVEMINPSGFYPLYGVYWTDGQQCLLNRTDIKFVRRNK